MRRATSSLSMIAMRRMVLLHGFQKKTQATPKADLDLARARKREDCDE
jgi:phage-related protein